MDADAFRLQDHARVCTLHSLYKSADRWMQFRRYSVSVLDSLWMQMQTRWTKHVEHPRIQVQTTRPSAGAHLAPSLARDPETAPMSSLAKALLDELSDVELDLLAQRLAPRLERLSCPKTRSTWLDVGEAADHLRCPKSRLYALVSARRIPHHKDGSRLLFRREELDEWVYNGGARRP